MSDREISAITGKPKPTTEEEFQARRGLLSSLAESYQMLEGTYGRSPDWQMASWTSGKDLPTRYGILKGLSQDIRAMDKSKINPQVLRYQYKMMHELPEEILSSPNSLKFVPELINPRTKDARTLGRHSYFDLTEESNISLAAGGLPNLTQTVTNPKFVDTRTVIGHEIAHAFERNPRLRRQLSHATKKSLDDLDEIAKQMPVKSSKEAYDNSPMEYIARNMEDFIKSKRASGDPITKDGFLKEFENVVKWTRRAYINE